MLLESGQTVAADAVTVSALLAGARSLTGRVPRPGNLNRDPLLVVGPCTPKSVLPRSGVTRSTSVTRRSGVRRRNARPSWFPLARARAPLGDVSAGLELLRESLVIREKCPSVPRFAAAVYRCVGVDGERDEQKDKK